jgi:ketosteroid isomerase-like protein
MKKLFMVLPLVLLLCLTFGCQKAEEVAEEATVGIEADVGIEVDVEAEEAAIRETMKKAWDGLNNHDIQAHLSTLTEDFETWSGRGEKKAREKFFTELWEWQKNVKFNVVEELGISFISADVALYKARFERTGEIEKDGTPIPRSEWQGVWILAKKGGKWLIPAWYTRPIEE